MQWSRVARGSACALTLFVLAASAQAQSSAPPPAAASTPTDEPGSFSDLAPARGAAKPSVQPPPAVANPKAPQQASGGGGTFLATPPVAQGPAVANPKAPQQAGGGGTFFGDPPAAPGPAKAVRAAATGPRPGQGGTCSAWMFHNASCVDAAGRRCTQTPGGRKCN